MRTAFSRASLAASRSRRPAVLGLFALASLAPLTLKAGMVTYDFTESVTGSTSNVTPGGPLCFAKRDQRNVPPPLPSSAPTGANSTRQGGAACPGHECRELDGHRGTESNLANGPDCS